MNLTLSAVPGPELSVCIYPGKNNIVSFNQKNITWSIKTNKYSYAIHKYWVLGKV